MQQLFCFLYASVHSGLFLVFQSSAVFLVLLFDPSQLLRIHYAVKEAADTELSELLLDFPWIASWAECTGFTPYAADAESYTLAKGDEKVVFHISESECYTERDGVRIELGGKMEWSKITSAIYLTTGDLTKLFDTELKFDYINGTAEITNKKM